LHWQNLLKMKKILVTGGAGFIGSHLCKKLVKEGHDVICLDNYFTGSKNNIIDLIGNPHFELVRHDITEPYQAEVDYIFNLACPASPIHYQFNPVKTVKTSVMGAINMLELAEENGATVLQASTSEVYGDPIIHPQVESYWGNVNPIGIRSCYDEGKRCAETLFMDYHRQKGVNIKIIRIFNTYGPNMHPQDGRVVSNFIMQAINNKDITIYGTGKQTRSFMYIDDLLDGMIKFVRSDKSFIGPLNIGNSHEFTISQLAEMVIKLCDSDSKVVYKPLPGDDPKQRQPDISLAVEKLGWKPEIHLEEGLIRTIDYFRKICR
jgi:UDP-glucuronate decarboxylase